ncbi:MAG: hypothetical protein AAFR96_02450 [Planctomycetota bacterium]
MPTTRQTHQARPVTNGRAHTTDTPTDRIIEAKPSKKFGKTNPDFAAMAGWRTGFDSPIHKARIVKALKGTSALCPGCGFDLIDQRRPDCPKCDLPIDIAALVVQDEPPSKLLTRSISAAVVLCWIAMGLGGFAWSGPLQAVGLTALFAVQLAGIWLLLSMYTDTSWYRSVSAPRRKTLLVGSISAVAVAGSIVASTAIALVS